MLAENYTPNLVEWFKEKGIQGKVKSKKAKVNPGKTVLTILSLVTL